MRDLLGNISLGLKIQQNQRVAKIEYFDDYWRLGTSRANFESELLVITTPLPQCVELLKTIPTFDNHDSLDEIKKIEYKKCIALIMTMGSESNFDYSYSQETTGGEGDIQPGMRVRHAVFGEGVIMVIISCCIRLCRDLSAGLASSQRWKPPRGTLFCHEPL